ncbi:hypothetical protein JW899_00455 [Candidatus Uhrbacteria bacterium]|nr:hypothetical protein [Candidatus Uhrbacteria bacterium]
MIVDNFCVVYKKSIKILSTILKQKIINPQALFLDFLALQLQKNIPDVIVCPKNLWQDSCPVSDTRYGPNTPDFHHTPPVNLNHRLPFNFNQVLGNLTVPDQTKIGEWGVGGKTIPPDHDQSCSLPALHKRRLPTYQEPDPEVHRTPHKAHRNTRKADRHAYGVILKKNKSVVKYFLF